MISLPLDGASEPNYILVYSNNLGQWQGIWNIVNMESSYGGYCSAAVDATNSVNTVLLYGTPGGFLYFQTYPELKQFTDLTTSQVSKPFTHSLTTRAYNWGEGYALVRPYQVEIKFVDSGGGAISTTYTADRSDVMLGYSGPTSIPVSTLPQNIPFVLSGISVYKVNLNIMSVGSCSEFQLKWSGTGNISVLSVIATAFVQRLPLAL
jgi:hypothetical protein